MYNKYCRIRLTSLILFLLASCKAPASLQPAASATLQPSETLPPTATVVPTETPTPLPTATPTSTETPVPTDTPTATLDLKATEAAQATADAKAEEEALVAEVVKELETYNIPTSEGGLIFHSDGPFHITADEYNETNYIALDPGVTYGEYVMHVDLKWESTSGLAGCGIRIHGKNIKDGDYFTFQTLRFSGLPAWAVSYVQDGIFQFNATGKVRFNDSIDLRQGSVNSYVLVVERALLTLYANTKKLGAVDTNRRRSGEIAFEAFQESGMTNCTLEHIWVWSLK